MISHLETSIDEGFSMAMLNNQMVYIYTHGFMRISRAKLLIEKKKYRLQGGAPPVVNQFITPIKYSIIAISTIYLLSTRVTGVMNQLT